MMNLTVTRVVYAALVSWADADGYVRGISQRRLAEDTGLDTTLVAAAIRILEYDNYVQRHGHSRTSGTAIYRVAPPEPIRPEPETPADDLAEQVEMFLRLVQGGDAS